MLKKETKLKKETNWDKVPLFFDLRYAATLLGISLDAMHKLCQQGNFPAFKVGVKLWRVEKTDLITYMEEQKHRNAGQQRRTSPAGEKGAQVYERLI